MQLFVKCGGSAGTVAVSADPYVSSEEVLSAVLGRSLTPRDSQHLGLVYGGRQLMSGVPLASYGVRPASTLHLCPLVLGGGGDGGSTGAESRSCYLEMYMDKKPDKVDPAEKARARWTRCTLSAEPLQPPVVADELGSLFNKDALIRGLLARSLPPAVAHISGLKHVVELRLMPAAGASTSANGKSRAARADEFSFQCPLSGLEFNGKFRFVAHKRTGVVVAERALKEAPAAVEELFGGPWAPSDLLLLNPSGRELALAKEAVRDRVAMDVAKRERKRKRKDASAAVDAAVVSAAGGTGGDSKRDQLASSNGQLGVGLEQGGGAIKGGGSVGARASKAAAAGGEEAHAAKKPAALKFLPAGASQDVFASLFTSSRTHTEKETYLSRGSNRGSLV